MADSQSDALKLVTIVCPVFNEEKAVPLFYGRLAPVLASLENRVRFEILFVNNRSTDGTEAEVMKLREKDPRVELLTLSRNYGYQASITAGTRRCVFGSCDHSALRLAPSAAAWMVAASTCASSAA